MFSLENLKMWPKFTTFMFYFLSISTQYLKNVIGEILKWFDHNMKIINRIFIGQNCNIGVSLVRTSDIWNHAGAMHLNALFDYTWPQMRFESHEMRKWLALYWKEQDEYSAWILMLGRCETTRRWVNNARIFE